MLEQKQIVFIMTDTTRRDMLGCYGNEKMVTPNLDELANEGIVYENAYTCQPVCGPARSAIFTGLFPHSNGMVTNTVTLFGNVKTVGQRLTDNGVHCGYVGKWHLDGGDYFGLGQCPEGWDENYWYDMKCYLDELSDEDKIKSRKADTSYDEDLKDSFTFADRCSDRAIDFIQKNKDDSFFLAVSYDEPHDPSVCPAPYSTMYDGFSFDSNPNYQDDLSKKPMLQQLWAGDNLRASEEEINKASKGLSLFLGCNSFVDYEIGRVLKEIKEKVPNAMVIFTSDHGDMLGNHRLRSKNASAYKEVANVPLIIKGGRETGRITMPASHIDLVPTFLDYFGIALPKILEGKSMLPQIYDITHTINDCVFTEFTRYEVDHDGFGGLQIMRSATSENYKLVINLLDTDEFYDLKKDPYEINNLIDDESYSEQRNILHDQILDNMNKTRDMYRGYQWLVRPWRKGKVASWNNDGYTRQRENEEYEPRQLDYDTGLAMQEAVRIK